MPRFRRVNLDGCSVTETRKTAAALLPGTLAFIDSTSDLFAQALAANVTDRLYILNPNNHEGLDIDDQIPSGNSAVGDYMEEGREFAALVPAGTYQKDQKLTLHATNGQLIAIPATPATYQVLATVQEEADITLSAAGFIRVRVARSSSVVVS
jgi:hypothetical protein